jgi:hypothetical protein
MLKIVKEIENWGKENTFKLLIFNTVLAFLILMRSAGYFLPFFGISINFIVLFLLVLSIFLLKAKSQSMFVMSLAFFLFAFILKLLKIDIWAERTTIYTFEALIIGTILLITESFKKSTPI